MVETPAAIHTLDKLAQEAAFFSIGTNDLTQYMMAADRLNPTARLAERSGPACRAARNRDRSRNGSNYNRHVGVCGEMAGDPVLAPLLVGLGVQSLSMTPASIPTVKEALSARTLDEHRALAVQALNLATVHEVRQLLENRSHRGAFMTPLERKERSS